MNLMIEMVFIVGILNLRFKFYFVSCYSLYFQLFLPIFKIISVRLGINFIYWFTLVFGFAILFS